MTPGHIQHPQHPRGGREIEMELLALDLTRCTRCTGTLANSEEAVETVRRTLEATGTTLRLRTTVVDSEQAAREHRFVSSPTIRGAGRAGKAETPDAACCSPVDLPLGRQVEGPARSVDASRSPARLLPDRSRPPRRPPRLRAGRFLRRREG